MNGFTFQDDGDQITLIAPDGKPAGEIAFMEAEDTLVVIHTGVEPDYRGKGLAEQLVFQLVEKARAEEKLVYPICPFARHQFEIRPDYADVLRVD
jgi:predicted GNAT family acetyltransferase